MSYNVIVAFGKHQEYGIGLTESELAGHTAEEARRWFETQYEELACEPSNPVGKVLVLDRILGVARSVGPEAFARGDTWAKRYALYAALVLGKDVLRIDVEGLTVDV